MIAKLRRISKSAAADSYTELAANTPIATATTTTNFFSLPAELRNVVYETVAAKTVLRITDHRSSRLSKKRPIPTPSLLVASQQCRAEYLPILLSTARIEISITDFDFSNLMRVTGSLYNTELRALRQNRRLMTILSFSRSPKLGALESNLRRWATHRSAALDRLPWQYRLEQDPHSAVGTVIYAKCMANLRMVYLRVEEALQWEVQSIMDAVDMEGRWRNEKEIRVEAARSVSHFHGAEVTI